jgi:hypothetical protein
MTQPPQSMIDIAIDTARRSPCAKSKRGVVVYAPTTTIEEGRKVGTGYNSMPIGTCDGSDACRAACNKRCVHAEDRAIRDALVDVSSRRLIPRAATEFYGKLCGHEAIHVKIVDGQLVGGGGPSCWQCSRLVVDVALDAFWLYEREFQSECDYADRGFAELPRGTPCHMCIGRECLQHSELAYIAGAYQRELESMRVAPSRGMHVDDEWKAYVETMRLRVAAACACTPAERHAGLPPPVSCWVRYTAEEFHRATLEACKL